MRRLIVMLAALALMVVSAPSAHAESCNGVYKQGSSGGCVRELQWLLLDHGHYVGSPDGDFGPVTKQRVVDFQKEVGLEADGIVGPLTWARLRATPAIPADTYLNDRECQKTYRVGTKGRCVVWVQRMVAIWGFSPGKVDGHYGRQTRDAVIQFQRMVGIEPDGVVGQETYFAFISGW